MQLYKIVAIVALKEFANKVLAGNRAGAEIGRAFVEFCPLGKSNLPKNVCL
ncbi:hypothetical protein D3C87_2187250 [compost metagenome]